MKITLITLLEDTIVDSSKVLIQQNYTIIINQCNIILVILCCMNMNITTHAYNITLQNHL